MLTGVNACIQPKMEMQAAYTLPESVVTDAGRVGANV